MKVKNDFGKNFKIIVLPRLGWSKFWLPLELRLHPVDVFLGLSQMLPLTRAQKIGFIYDLGFLHFPEAYPDSFERLKKQTDTVIKRANHIVTISEQSKTDIIKTYGKENVTVAHPGVDKHFTKSGPKHKEKYPYMLMVGSLKRIKNIPLAIAWFQDYLKQTKKPYILVIVGGDYWRDPEIPKAKHVKFVGYVPDNDLPSYYRGAAKLLVSSHWEGFCLPAAEATACGCPVENIGENNLPTAVHTTWLQFAKKVYTLI